MMTHCLRPILLGGVLLMATSCASEDYSTWASHPTHYASGSHMGFSYRTVGASRVKVTPEEVALAQKEQWWGRGISGMLGGGLAGQPAAIAGNWNGGWIGRGMSTERTGRLLAEFAVTPDGYGKGYIALGDTEGVEGVPWTVRQATTMGVPVWVKVEGNTIMLLEASPTSPFEPRFSAEFVAEGDRLVGQFRNFTAGYRSSIAPVRMTLFRQS